MRNRLQAAFSGVHAEAALKERTLRVIYSEAPARKKRMRALALAAACLALTVGLFSGLFFTPVSAIGIEVNPALRLKINRFDIVVGVEALNEDGRRILDGTDLMFSEYSEAIDTLLSDPHLRAYLERGKDMEIYVECGDEQRCARMLDKVEGCVGGNGNVTCHAGSGQGHGHGNSGGNGSGEHCGHHRHRGGKE